MNHFPPSPTQVKPRTAKYLYMGQNRRRWGGDEAAKKVDDEEVDGRQAGSCENTLSINNNAHFLRLEQSAQSCKLGPQRLCTLNWRQLNHRGPTKMNTQFLINNRHQFTEKPVPPSSAYRYPVSRRTWPQIPTLCSAPYTDSTNDDDDDYSAILELAFSPFCSRVK